MGYLTATPPPVRKAGIPAAAKARIDTPRMAQLLYGPGRVYAEQERPAKPEGSADEPWGRVVVMLADFLFPRGQAMPGRQEAVPFLVRAEVTHLRGWDYARALEAILEEAFRRLQGARLALRGSMVLFPIYWRGLVNERPLRNDAEGTWVQTSEFRTVLQPVEV